MIDTKRLRGWDEFLAENIPEEKFEDRDDLTYLLSAAADEIDAGRNARLAQYRAALVSGNVSWYANAGGVLNADAVERDARAMLAAERPVTP